MNIKFCNSLVVIVSLALIGPVYGKEDAPGKAGRHGSGDEEKTVLATVEGETLTVAAFRNEMARRDRLAPGGFQTPEDREALLEEMLAFEALVAKARKAGYDKDPEIVAALKRMMVTRFEQDQLNEKLEKVEVSDEDIKQHYEEHIAQYSTPERVRGAIIFIEIPFQATEERIARLAEKVESVRAEALARAAEGSSKEDPAGFGPLARKYSDDRASRYLGGEIGWLARGGSYKWEDEVVDTLFAATEPGTVSPVIHTGKGFYLVKLIEKKAAAARPIGQFEDAIRHRLLQDKKSALRQAFHESIRREVDIQVDRALLNSIEPPPRPGEKAPPAIPKE